MAIRNSGAPLTFVRWQTIEDGRLARFIYVDEAGTSPAEPVRVVAAIIAHGDDHVRQIAEEMEKIFDESVPSNIRDGFVFHGLEVFNGGRKINRRVWSFAERLEFFKKIVGLPRIFGVPISVGVHFTNVIHLSDEIQDVLKSKNISISAFEHAQAFAKCLERADLFLRKYLDGREIGTVIAEEANERKKLLSAVSLRLRKEPLYLSSGALLQSSWEKALNASPKPHLYTIKNIVDVPHFVPKSGAPLLQLADACAFSFRRFLSKKSYGSELCLAMLGEYEGKTFVNDPVWFSGGSSGLFNTARYWSEEQRREADEVNFTIRLMRLLGGQLPS
ncbi:MAG: DUF3800 domain-containing protein [Sphingomonas sp.]